VRAGTIAKSSAARLKIRQAEQAVEAQSTAEVGRIGLLDLEYAYRDDRTVLSRSSCSTPWHFLPPGEFDDTRGLYTFLVNPSGGLVGGDHLTVQAEVGSGAQALFSTPSANRIYRSTGPVARQTVRLLLKPGAIVEWVPEPSIPYAASRYAQTFDITVGAGATLWFWESFACGRIASGERWAFTEFSSEIKIAVESGGTALERMVIDESQSAQGIGLVEPWNYVASVFLVSDALSDAALSEIGGEAAAAIESYGSLVLGGVSRPAIPGLAMKIVAETGQGLNDVLVSVWEIVRRRLWNRGLPPLRKY
jgi:urease accessory protein